MAGVVGAGAGKRIVVTGSTRGIGRGLAQALLERGASVMVSGRSDAGVTAASAALAAAVPGCGGRIAGQACDVTQVASVQGLWDAAVAAFGGVDVWVNNAGVSHGRKPLWEQPPGIIDDVVATNLNGVLYGSQVALAGFVAQGSGALWNMEGLGSDGRVIAGTGIYGSTKSAVRYVTKSLVKDAKEHALPAAIQICFLSPGIVATDLLVKDYDGDRAAWEKAKKMFNILADEVGTVAPFLADGILASTKSGTKVTWLTPQKVAKRFATARFAKRTINFGEPAA